jgi:hypothetical protein
MILPAFHVDMEEDTDVFSVSDPKSATLDLPADPTEIPSEPPEPRQHADDLIASMADQQIEAMLAEAEAAEERVERGLEKAPSEEPAPAVTDVVPVAPDEVVDKPALEPQAALDAVKEAVAEPVVESTQPIEAPREGEAPAEPTLESPVAAVVAEAPAPSVEPVQDQGSAGASPAQDAPLQETPVEETPVVHAPALIDMTGKVAGEAKPAPETETPAEPAKEDLHDEPLEDSAAAVAKELEEEETLAAKRQAEAGPGPSKFRIYAGKALAFLASVPLLMLQALNYPFQHVSDRAREVIAAIALMTLFNSVAILIYVIVFR